MGINGAFTPYTLLRIFSLVIFGYFYNYGGLFGCKSLYCKYLYI